MSFGPTATQHHHHQQRGHQPPRITIRAVVDAMDEDQGIDLSRIPCDDGMGLMTPKIKKATTVESINGLKDGIITRPREAAAAATGRRATAAAASTNQVAYSTLYLAALRIFLSEHAGGKATSQRLASAKSLSVASLQSCEECREAIAFHVWVGNDTPRSLWASRTRSNARESPAKPSPVQFGGGGRCEPSSCEPASPRRERVTHELERSPPKLERVPAVRAAKVTWDKPSAQELRCLPHEEHKGDTSSFPLLMEVKCVAFGDAFNGCVVGIAWPRGLEQITFGSAFNQPLQGVAWPRRLKEISFGKSFNCALGGVSWPEGLERLTFGHGFAQPCADIAWPARLSEITFGHEYNHPIEPVRWPRSLARLTFGYKFNQPVQGGGGISWPASLKVLSFGWKFNRCLRGVALPGSLETLTIAGVYDRPIDEVQLPQGLKKLVLGGHFNQSLEFVRWPAGLEELALGWAFDQPLLGVRWPPRLKRLCLGYRFNQPREYAKWPEALEELELGVFSRLSLEGMVWPLSLKKLAVSRAFDIAGLVLPEGARVCRRGQSSSCEARRVARHR